MATPATAISAPPPSLPALPPPFLQTLVKNPNVSAACVAGANRVLQDSVLARQAEYFSGRVSEGLSLLLPPVLKHVVFAKDKRLGLGEFIYQPPLWSLGVPDSCGYIGLDYCQIDVIPVFTKWGVCVPPECSADDIKTAIFPPVTQELAERVKARCGPMNADKALFLTVEPLSAGAWAALILIALLIIFASAATILDVYGGEWNMPYLQKGRMRSVVDSFSLSRNYERLMAPPRAGPFASFDAVRTLAMGMILLGHTLYFNLTVVGITNPRESLGFYGRGFLATGPGLIANGSLLGVDTFLGLAGFLAFYIFLKELEKRLDLSPRARKPQSAVSLQQGPQDRAGTCGRGAWKVTQMALVAYLRRYLRLTPAYAVILLIFTFLAPLMSSAPPSPTGVMQESQVCKEKWWQNLLYINNILSNPYTMCYQASWFLAVVQQLFLLVPWLSALAFLRPWFGLMVGVALCVGSYVYTFQHSQAQGWRINSIDRPGFPRFFADFYAGTFTRMPTFLIGGMAAILYFKYGDRCREYWQRKSLQAPGTVRVQVWAVIGLALALFAAAIFGPYRELAFAPGKWSQTTSSSYITLAFSAWVLGLCFLCGVLAMGKGGLLKRFLELPFWAVTSRLTYSTYLVHPMVILSVISSDGGQPFHFSMLHIFNDFLGYSVLSGISAVIFFFLVEAPFGELERLLFSRLPPPSLSTTLKEKCTTEGKEYGEKNKCGKEKEVLVILSEASEAVEQREARGNGNSDGTQ